ncbi:helix-turn-helix transcriptional regulator [bacterium]|nr:helix-turn-helix transcriptional regulator [bacterium]
MNKTYLEKVAERIRKLRTEKGLTQDDLGTNGISRQMVNLLELAKTDITVSKLKVLADNMGIKVKDIFDFE